VSWSHAAAWLLAILLSSGVMTWAIARIIAGPDDERLRSSHDSQFSNTSRQHYVARRSFR
jgi:hypothetical protein